MSGLPSVRSWLADAAQRIDAALGPARVKRVVLPPLADRPGKEGEFCAVQLDDGSVGLAFTLLDGTLAALHARGSDAGCAALELVRGYTVGDGAARALGLAAINALARRLYDRAGFIVDDSTDSFGSLALMPGDRLGMVGHFTPLIEQARALGIPVTVLELKAELVREEPGLIVTLDATAWPAATRSCRPARCCSTTPSRRLPATGAAPTRWPSSALPPAVRPIRCSPPG